MLYKILSWKKEEEPSPSLANARGRLLHYLGRGGGNTSSGRTVTAADRVASEVTRQERHNAWRRAVFATSVVAPDWVLPDPDLTWAWPEDRSTTTARRLRRLSDHLVKIVVAESLRVGALVAGKDKARGGIRGRRGPAPGGGGSRSATRERQAAVNLGCRGPYVPYYRWKDRDGHGDGADDAGGAAGQGGHAYEVTVWYLP